MRSRRLAGLVVGVTLSAVSLGGCGQPGWQIELVSVNAAGDDSGNRWSQTPAVSPDGTKVAFMSSATDLGPNDPEGNQDIYVRDLTTGTTTLVTTSTVAGHTGTGSSPQFTPDGEQIVFVSTSRYLGAPGTGRSNVYMKHLTTGAVTLVSVDATGTAAANDRSYNPVISEDGTRIAFLSEATNLVPTDTRNNIDVYVRDLVAGTTTLVSANVSNTDSGNDESTSPVISPDGTTVAFNSEASDLVPGDANNWSDVFVRDLATGTTTLVSTNAAGSATGNSYSSGSSFTPDGNGFVFTSNASDLGPTDTNGATDVFLRDLVAGTTTAVSTKAGTAQTANGFSRGGEVSPDGSKVLFRSWASDLGPHDPTGYIDLYIHDLSTGENVLVTANADGSAGGNGDWYYEPAGYFSPDGSKVAFHTASSNLGPTDTNGLRDVYVRDLAAGTTTLVSATPDRSNGGNRVSLWPVFGADSNTVVFVSCAGNLGPPDSDRPNSNDEEQADVYLAHLR